MGYFLLIIFQNNFSELDVLAYIKIKKINKDALEKFEYL